MTGQGDTDVTAERRPSVPLGRPGDARDVAAVIAFLAERVHGRLMGGGRRDATDGTAGR